MADRSIGTISKKLHDAYKQWKKSEKEKNKYKGEFFSWVTEENSKIEPDVHITSIFAESKEKAQEKAEEYFSSCFHIESIKQKSDTESDEFDVMLIELPEFRGYTHIDRDLGVVFQKQVVKGSLQLDDDTLREENPELWEAITYLPEPKRVLKNFDDFTDEQLTQVNKYMYEGKPVVKFPAPRQAKPEELE